MLAYIRSVVLLLLVGLLAACQSSQVTKLYDGPERAAAEVVVVLVPETLEILTINGQRPSGLGNRLVSADRTLHVMPGRYQVIAFYKDIWTPSSASTHEVLRSQPVIFDIDGRAGDSFQLEYKQPETYEAARELAENFSGWSRNTVSNERVATRPSGIARPGLLSGVVNTGAGQASPSVLPQTTTVAPAANVEPTAALSADGIKDSAYLDMLKAYWSQASQEERRAFLRWVAE